MLYKPSALPPFREETRKYLYFQPDHRNSPFYEYDVINTASGYIPSYTRTELTDDLHKTFGFRTDYEFITKASMRNIIKQTKAIKKENK